MCFKLISRHHPQDTPVRWVCCIQGKALSPDYVLATLSLPEYERYATLRARREAAYCKATHDSLTGTQPLLRVKTEPRPYLPFRPPMATCPHRQRNAAEYMCLSINIFYL